MSQVRKLIALDNINTYYALLDNKGNVIEPSFSYAQFLFDWDLISSENTQKTIYYRLKPYFDFLEAIGTNWYSIRINNIVDFTNWYQAKYKKNIFISKKLVKIIRELFRFYDYLIEQDYYSSKLSEQLKYELVDYRNNPGLFIDKYTN